MHSTIDIAIAAPPELVYRLARDVTRWSRILPHYSRSAVVQREADGVLVCDFIARRPFVPVLGLGLPVTWRSRTWHEPATRRLRFLHRCPRQPTRRHHTTPGTPHSEGRPDVARALHVERGARKEPRTASLHIAAKPHREGQVEKSPVSWPYLSR